MNQLINILVAHGNIYSLADIHNMFGICDVQFDYNNQPYMKLGRATIHLSKEALSFITPIAHIN